MARYIKHKFTKDQERLAVFSNALSHPARIAIIESLKLKPLSTCGDIVNQLPYSQSTVSQHLIELKVSGIVSMKNEGTKTMYSLDQNTIDEYLYLFNSLIKKISL